MSKSSFKILFYLRKNYVNKEGKASIMIRITVNGEMSQFSSKLDVEPSLWNTKLGRLSGNGAKWKSHATLTLLAKIVLTT